MTMLQVRCPHCQHPYQLPETVRGKKARCRNCQEVFVIEPEDEAGDETEPVAQPLAAPVDEEEAAPPPAAEEEQPSEDDGEPLPARMPLKLDVAAGAPTGPKLVVDPDGRGDHRTIDAAIKAAPHGALILVRPGTYRESLVLDKVLDIAADGDPGCVVIEAKDGSPCLRMETEWARLRGIALDGRGAEFAIDVPRGRLTLEGCDVHTAAVACVAVHGASAEVALRGCWIHDSAQIGLWFDQGSKGAVEGCELWGHALSGVEITQGSEPILKRCAIRDGGQVGVIVLNGGRGTIEECDISGHGLTNVQVSGGADPVLLRCRIHDGKQGGILVCDGGRGTFEQCLLFGNGYAAVQISSGGDPVLRRCYVQEGLQTGVLVCEGGLGTLERCEIHSHPVAGVEIRDGGAPVLLLCRIFEEKKVGIVVHRGGRGSVEDCDIFRNALAGVQVCDDGDPVLRRCRIHDGKQAGVLVCDDGRGTIEDCTISGNALSGLQISRGAEPVVRRCRIHDGKQAGVLVSQDAGGTLEECEVFRNQLAGVEVREGGEPDFHRCKIHSNGTVAARLVGTRVKDCFRKCRLRGRAWEPALILGLVLSLILTGIGLGAATFFHLRGFSWVWTAPAAVSGVVGAVLAWACLGHGLHRIDEIRPGSRKERRAPKGADELGGLFHLPDEGEEEESAEPEAAADADDWEDDD